MAARQPETKPSAWRSFADITEPKQPPTPIQAKAIADVHELAFLFDRGETTVAEIRAATSGKQRWKATQHTSKDHPAFGPLMAMLDALLASEQRVAVTDHGMFSMDELIDAGMRIVHDNGRTVICLAKRRPWFEKPDPDRGIDGIRGDPVFRPREEWGTPNHGNFGVNVQTSERKQRAPEWWEEEAK